MLNIQIEPAMYMKKRVKNKNARCREAFSTGGFDGLLVTHFRVFIGVDSGPLTHYKIMGEIEGRQGLADFGVDGVNQLASRAPTRAIVESLAVSACRLAFHQIFIKTSRK